MISYTTDGVKHGTPITYTEEETEPSTYYGNVYNLQSKSYLILYLV